MIEPQTFWGVDTARGPRLFARRLVPDGDGWRDVDERVAWAGRLSRIEFEGHGTAHAGYGRTKAEALAKWRRWMLAMAEAADRRAADLRATVSTVREALAEEAAGE